MLQTIREHTQGWIAGAIISVIILTFALWGIHSYFVGGAANTNVAEVNGVEITKEQLAVTYERIRRQTQVQYGPNHPFTAKDELALKSRALQALIEIETLKQASYRQGFRIYDRQIDNYLQSMPEFQVDGQFSVERFQGILSSTMLSTGEFLDLIKTSLLIDQPRLGIMLTSFALPDETTYTISLVNQERDVAYVNIPLQSALSKLSAISPAQIKEYYEKHKSDFMTPEQVNIEYLQLSLNDLTAAIPSPEPVLKNFYNENINSYTQAMQWKIATVEIPETLPTPTQDELNQLKKKADNLVRQLKTNAKFDKLAHDFAAKITEYKWLTLNQVPPEAQKAVAQLTKPGQVSAPFKTAHGFMIVKAIAIQAPQIQSFESVKDKVKEAYVRQHAEEKLASLRDQLADLTYEHPDSLQLAAKELNLPIKTSELFSKDKPGKDISQNKKVRDAAFSNDVLNLQNNSDVIQVSPDTLIVLRVKSHVASTLLPLTSVSQQIEAKLKARQEEAGLADYAKDLRQKLLSGSDAEQLAKSLKLTWTQLGFIGRYSTKVDSAILDLAFRMANPANHQNHVAYDITRVPNGYAIVALKAVKQGSVSDTKQYSVFAEQMQDSEGVLEYELYKQSQAKSTKIKIQQTS